MHIDAELMEHPDGNPGYLEPGHISVASLVGDHARPPDAVECIYFKDLHYYEGEAGGAPLPAKRPALAPKWPGGSGGEFRSATMAYFEGDFHTQGWPNLRGVAPSVGCKSQLHTTWT